MFKNRLSLIESPKDPATGRTRKDPVTGQKLGKQPQPMLTFDELHNYGYSYRPKHIQRLVIEEHEALRDRYDARGTMEGVYDRVHVNLLNMVY